MNKRILINFPTNIGDVILALPVVDRLRSLYPNSPITAIASQRTKSFLSVHSFIGKVILFDKRWPPRIKLQFTLSLRGKFDVVVDLKNSLLPFIIHAGWHTPFIRFFRRDQHITHRYLSLIKTLGESSQITKGDVIIKEEDRAKWDAMNISGALAIGCSSQFHLKQYPYDKLKRVVEMLSKEYPVLILGEEKERAFYRDILTIEGVVDLVGKTTLVDVFYILKEYCRLLIAVDSSLMHMAGYLNVPVVALFGPTSPGRSYPLSDKSIILQKTGVDCIPCEDTVCVRDHACMNIGPHTVLGAVKNIIADERA